MKRTNVLKLLFLCFHFSERWVVGCIQHATAIWPRKNKDHKMCTPTGLYSLGYSDWNILQTKLATSNELRDLRFSQWCRWRFSFLRTWIRAVAYAVTDVSNVRSTLFLGSNSPGPEDESKSFLRNMGKHTFSNTATHSRITESFSGNSSQWWHQVTTQRSMLMCDTAGNLNNKGGNVHVNVTLGRVRLTITAVEEQWALHILSVCL
jgi:hypothetical protein